MYLDGLANLPAVSFLGRAGHDPQARTEAQDNCWLTCMVLDPALTVLGPTQLIAELASQDIESRRLWKPMHLQPVFATSRSINGASEHLLTNGVRPPSGTALHDDNSNASSTCHKPHWR